MTHATYTLSSRQSKDLVCGVIRVAIPIPRDWDDAMEDDAPDLVQWCAESLGVLPQSIDSAMIRDVAVVPGRAAPGLTGLLGRILQDGERADLWCVQIGCVVVELRGARTIRPQPGAIQWPGSVRYGEWRYPAAG